MDTKLAANELHRLFEAAAVAFCQCLTDPLQVLPREIRDTDLRAADLESLLHDWLRELQLVFATEQVLFCQAVVLIEDTPGALSLKARLRGEPLDRQRHNLALAPGPAQRPRVWKDATGHWHAQLSFDHHDSYGHSGDLRL